MLDFSDCTETGISILISAADKLFFLLSFSKVDRFSIRACYHARDQTVSCGLDLDLTSSGNFRTTRYRYTKFVFIAFVCPLLVSKKINSPFSVTYDVNLETYKHNHFPSAFFFPANISV